MQGARQAQHEEAIGMHTQHYDTVQARATNMRKLLVTYFLFFSHELSVTYGLHFNWCKSGLRQFEIRFSLLHIFQYNALLVAYKLYTLKIQFLVLLVRLLDFAF